MEIKPEDEKRVVTGKLFTDDGESAQAQRDEELRLQRQQKIKEAEERKLAMQAEKQKSNNGNWFLKKIRLVSDNVEKLANDFLKDDDKE